MIPASDSTVHPTQSFPRWLLRRIMPGFLLGGILGAGIVLTEKFHAPWLRVLSLLGAALCAIGAVLYLCAAVSRSRGVGYHWSTGERLGTAASGIAILVLAAKLALLDRLPGGYFVYFVTTLVIAFVVRPLLER